MKKIILMMLIVSGVLFAENFVVFDEELSIDYSDLERELAEYPEISLYALGKHHSKVNGFLQLRENSLEQNIRSDKRLSRINDLQELLENIPANLHRELVSAKFFYPKTAHSQASRENFKSMVENYDYLGSCPAAYSYELANFVVQDSDAYREPLDYKVWNEADSLRDILDFLSRVSIPKASIAPIFFREQYNGYLDGFSSSLTDVAAQSGGELQMYLSTSLGAGNSNIITSEAIDLKDFDFGLSSHANVAYFMFNFQNDPVKLSDGLFNNWSLLSMFNTSSQEMIFDHQEDALIAREQYALNGEVEMQAPFPEFDHNMVSPGSVDIYFDNQIGGFDYLSWGFWYAQPSVGGHEMPAAGTFVAGSHLTTVQELQNLAQKERREITYLGQALGLTKSAEGFKAFSNGSTNLSVNFHTGNIRGNINFDQNTKISLQNGRINKDVVGGIYQGQAKLNGAGTGTFQGRFHGSNAQETGGSFSVNGQQRISGSFAAKRVVK